MRDEKTICYIVIYALISGPAVIIGRSMINALVNFVKIGHFRLSFRAAEQKAIYYHLGHLVALSLPYVFVVLRTSLLHFWWFSFGGSSFSPTYYLGLTKAFPVHS
jgi:hypothetical protein